LCKTPKTPKGQASPDAVLAGNATSYNDTAVVAGTSYLYRISFARGVRPPLTATGVETGPEPRDSDGDRLTDGAELAGATNLGAFSSDDDMLGDGFELANGLDPFTGDEDGNGVPDQHDDFDGDGLTDKHEFGSCRPVGIRPDGRLSQRPHERVVVGMRSDPKPRDRVIVNQAKRPPADPDSDGPHASRTYLLECQTRMPGVIKPESIILAGGLPDVIGKSFQAGEKRSFQLRLHRSSIRMSRVWPERILARTFSASCAISGCDAANAASQRVSSASSSRIKAAMVSCSAGLHFRSWSIACSRSLVIRHVLAGGRTSKDSPVNGTSAKEGL